MFQELSVSLHDSSDHSLTEIEAILEGKTIIKCPQPEPQVGDWVGVRVNSNASTSKGRATRHFEVHIAQVSS